MICPECGTRLPTSAKKCHFCGTEVTNITLTDNSNFINKFVALFTLLALFVAFIIYFNNYFEINGKELVPDATVRAVISAVIAAILTYFYWFMSPLMIRTLIDSLKPFKGNIWRMFILLGFYFLLVIANFLIIPKGISLVTFIILTIILVVIYQKLS